MSTTAESPDLTSPEQEEEEVVERETPTEAEEAQETGDVTEPTAEQAAALSEKEMERAVKKLETEAIRHRNRVSEIMGEDAQQLEPCPLCEPAIPGFVWPATPVTEETRQATLAAVGMGDLAERQHDPEAEECDLCAGQGELLTGSRVPEQLTRPCPKCGANGWTSGEQRRTWEATRQAQEAAAALPPYHPTSAPAPPAIETAGLPPIDAWGRPVGSEFYGRNPTYMTAEENARDQSRGG